MRLLCGCAAAVVVTCCGGPGEPGPASTTAPSPAVVTAPEVSVQGTVVPGVEAGCLLLDTGAKRYLLIGGDRNVLRPGRKVIVRGVPKPDLLSICQQGDPLEVTEVRPAGPRT